jgi:hypothetical protein
MRDPRNVIDRAIQRVAGEIRETIAAMRRQPQFRPQKRQLFITQWRKRRQFQGWLRDIPADPAAAEAYLLSLRFFPSQA